MKVIIAGGRDCNDKSILAEAILNSGFNITEIVSGGATGADALGEAFAKEFMIPLTKFDAQWATHGKAAGPIRNKEMAEYVGKLGGLIALWDGNSGGTLDCINKCKDQGVMIHIERY